MQFSDGTKYLRVARLIELLSGLPPECCVTPNAVGNLAVLDASDAGYLGYVDFLLDGEVILDSSADEAEER